VHKNNKGRLWLRYLDERVVDEAGLARVARRPHVVGKVARGLGVTVTQS